MANRRAQDPVGYWFNSLKKRSQDLDYEFDLSKEWIESQLKSMTCALTGLPLQHTENCQPRKGKQRNPWAPSFDRIDTHRGYTQDNVHVICWALNAAKGPWDLEVYETVAQAYMEKQSASDKC